jgi:hypothetical protein
MMPFGLPPSSLGVSRFLWLTTAGRLRILPDMAELIPESDVMRGTGPFRGRFYRRLPNGSLQRVRPVAADKQPPRKVVAEEVLAASGRKQRGSLREQHFQKAFQDA